MPNCSGIHLKFSSSFQNHSHTWSVNARLGGDGKETQICGVCGLWWGRQVLDLVKTTRETRNNIRTSHSKTINIFMYKTWTPLFKYYLPYSEQVIWDGISRAIAWDNSQATWVQTNSFVLGYSAKATGRVC